MYYTITILYVYIYTHILHTIHSIAYTTLIPYYTILYYSHMLHSYTIYNILYTGGIAREFYGILCEQIFNPDCGLFLSSSVNQMCMQINPNSGIANEYHLRYFHMVRVSHRVYTLCVMYILYNLHTTPACHTYTCIRTVLYPPILNIHILHHTLHYRWVGC